MKEAMEVMSAKRMGMTTVVDAGGRLSGIITDGDLRRHQLARGSLLDHRAEECMSRNPRRIDGDELAAHGAVRDGGACHHAPHHHRCRRPAGRRDPPPGHPSRQDPVKRVTARAAARIRLLVLDVDGVLTDGGLYYGPSGEDTKRFHVQDGLAMVEARRAGLTLAVVSGRKSSAVVAPARGDSGSPRCIRACGTRAVAHRADGAPRSRPGAGGGDGRRPERSAAHEAGRPGAGAAQCGAARSARPPTGCRGGRAGRGRCARRSNSCSRARQAWPPRS